MVAAGNADFEKVPRSEQRCSIHRKTTFPKHLTIITGWINHHNWVIDHRLTIIPKLEGTANCAHSPGIMSFSIDLLFRRIVWEPQVEKQVEKLRYQTESRQQSTLWKMTAATQNCMRCGFASALFELVGTIGRRKALVSYRNFIWAVSKKHGVLFAIWSSTVLQSVLIL